MSTEPTPLTSTTPTAVPLPVPRSKRRHIPDLASWVVGTFIVLLLVGVAMPNCNRGNIRSPQIQALAQAKQIGLALKLFASDHDGNYPRAGAAI